MEYKCEYCGKVFESVYPHVKYCSKRCRAEAAEERAKRREQIREIEELLQSESKPTELKPEKYRPGNNVLCFCERYQEKVFAGQCSKYQRNKQPKQSRERWVTCEACKGEALRPLKGA